MARRAQRRCRSPPGSDARFSRCRASSRCENKPANTGVFLPYAAVFLAGENFTGRGGENFIGTECRVNALPQQKGVLFGLRWGDCRNYRSTVFFRRAYRSTNAATHVGGHFTLTRGDGGRKSPADRGRISPALALFSLFAIIRALLLDLPAREFQIQQGLASLMLRVQNDGLRPHLTRWQADFRRWWDHANALQENAALPPQELQRQYPRYAELVEDLKTTNTELQQVCR